MVLSSDRFRLGDWLVDPSLNRVTTAGNRVTSLVEESKGMAQAEDGLLHTIEVAKAQGTTYTELRAATRLARLWRDQNRIDEARALLQPIVARFSKDIDTLPLLGAKALLWDLTGGSIK